MHSHDSCVPSACSLTIFFQALLAGCADGKLPLIYYKEGQPLKDLAKLFQTNGEGQVVEVENILLPIDLSADQAKLMPQRHLHWTCLN